MKKIIQFDLDGMPVCVEVEEKEGGSQRVSRSEDGIEKTNARFQDALAHIKPAAEAVLKTFQDINTPAEINLEFGVKFNAKAGVLFASADSEATFKVSLKWKNS